VNRNCTFAAPSAIRRVLCGVLTAAAVVAVLASAAVAQGNLGFLKSAPVASMTESDMKLVREAAAAVMNGSNGEARSWQNSASGNSGRIQRLSSFNTEDGRECRRLRFENQTKKGVKGASVMNICRASGGDWLLDPDARPAPKG